MVLSFTLSVTMKMWAVNQCDFALVAFFESKSIVTAQQILHDGNINN